MHVRGIAHYQKVEEQSRKKNDIVVEEAGEEDDDKPNWAFCNFCSDEFDTEEVRKS